MQERDRKDARDAVLRLTSQEYPEYLGSIRLLVRGCYCSWDYQDTPWEPIAEELVYGSYELQDVFSRRLVQFLHHAVAAEKWDLVQQTLVFITEMPANEIYHEGLKDTRKWDLELRARGENLTHALCRARLKHVEQVRSKAAYSELQEVMDIGLSIPEVSKVYARANKRHQMAPEVGVDPQQFVLFLQRAEEEIDFLEAIVATVLKGKYPDLPNVAKNLKKPRPYGRDNINTLRELQASREVSPTWISEDPIGPAIHITLKGIRALNRPRGVGENTILKKQQLVTRNRR